MKCVSWSHIDVLTCFSPLSGIDLPAAVLLYRGDGKIKLKLFSWLDLHFCSIYVSDQTYGVFFKLDLKTRDKKDAPAAAADHDHSA